MKFKKGVSALIATILLIVVAVALIAIILTWGKSFTTGSLSETANAIDLSCTGAAITISDCKIDTNSNLEFFVKNISSTYTFLTTDAFKVDLTDTAGGFKAGITMSDYTTTTWAGLAPGEIIKIDMNRTVAARLVTGTNVGVTVRSSVCGNDAIAAFPNCHQ